MGRARGGTEFDNYKDGKALTMKESIKAQCFQCNGEEEGCNEDCRGESCPLYPWFKKWMLRKTT